MDLGVFKRRIDVDVETQITPLKSLYASGDKNAHTFELSLYRGAEEIDLSGANALGYFIRADGHTISIKGETNGNIVTLTLSEGCYYVVGDFHFVIMMAMLWAQQIMLGKKTYAQVPRLLKDKVKEVLIDSGCEDLVTE